MLWCVTRKDLFAPALAQAGLLPGRVVYVEAGDEASVLACFEDPSFNAPIYANLFDDEDSDTFSLLWSRPSGRRGD